MIGTKHQNGTARRTTNPGGTGHNAKRDGSRRDRLRVNKNLQSRYGDAQIIDVEVLSVDTDEVNQTYTMNDADRVASLAATRGYDSSLKTARRHMQANENAWPPTNCTAFDLVA
ncbi:MAG: hypothetical protein AAF720_15755 [Pseudomonadota bacterium]